MHLRINEYRIMMRADYDLICKLKPDFCNENTFEVLGEKNQQEMKNKKIEIKQSLLNKTFWCLYMCLKGCHLVAKGETYELNNCTESGNLRPDQNFEDNLASPDIVDSKRRRETLNYDIKKES